MPSISQNVSRNPQSTQETPTVNQSTAEQQNQPESVSQSLQEKETAKTIKAVTANLAELQYLEESLASNLAGTKTNLTKSETALRKSGMIDAMFGTRRALKNDIETSKAVVAARTAELEQVGKLRAVGETGLENIQKMFEVSTKLESEGRTAEASELRKQALAQAQVLEESVKNVTAAANKTSTNYAKAVAGQGQKNAELLATFDKTITVMEVTNQAGMIALASAATVATGGLAGIAIGTAAGSGYAVVNNSAQASLHVAYGNKTGSEAFSEATDQTVQDIKTSFITAASAGVGVAAGAGVRSVGVVSRLGVKASSIVAGASGGASGGVTSTAISTAMTAQQAVQDFKANYGHLRGTERAEAWQQQAINYGLDYKTLTREFIFSAGFGAIGGGIGGGSAVLRQGAGLAKNVAIGGAELGSDVALGLGSASYRASLEGRLPTFGEVTQEIVASVRASLVGEFSAKARPRGGEAVSQRSANNPNGLSPADQRYWDIVDKQPSIGNPGEEVLTTGNVRRHGTSPEAELALVGAGVGTGGHHLSAALDGSSYDAGGKDTSSRLASDVDDTTVNTGSEGRNNHRNNGDKNESAQTPEHIKEEANNHYAQKNKEHIASKEELGVEEFLATLENVDGVTVTTPAKSLAESSNNTIALSKEHLSLLGEGVTAVVSKNGRQIPIHIVTSKDQYFDLVDKFMTSPNYRDGAPMPPTIIIDPEIKLTESAVSKLLDTAVNENLAVSSRNSNLEKSIKDEVTMLELSANSKIISFADGKTEWMIPEFADAQSKGFKDRLGQVRDLAESEYIELKTSSLKDANESIDQLTLPSRTRVSTNVGDAESLSISDPRHTERQKPTTAQGIPENGVVTKQASMVESIISEATGKVDYESVLRALDGEDIDVMMDKSVKAEIPKMVGLLHSGDREILSITSDPRRNLQLAALYQHALDLALRGDSALLGTIKESSNFKSIDRLYRDHAANDFMQGLVASSKFPDAKFDPLIEAMKEGRARVVVLDSDQLMSLYNQDKLRYRHSIYMPGLLRIEGAIEPFRSTFEGANLALSIGDDNLHFANGQHRSARTLLGTADLEQVLSGYQKVHIEKITPHYVISSKGEGDNILPIRTEKLEHFAYCMALHLDYNKFTPDELYTIFGHKVAPASEYLLRRGIDLASYERIDSDTPFAAVPQTNN